MRTIQYIGILPLLIACIPEPTTDKNVEPSFLLTVTHPEEITTSTALLCYSTATDENNDQLSIQHRWTNASGDVLSETGELQLSPEIVQPEEVLTCTATISDNSSGNWEVDATQTATVTVSNTEPAIDSIAIRATPNGDIEVTSTLYCEASASDVDAENVAVVYSWTQNGTAVSSEQELVLNPTDFQKGDVLDCVVTATDGFGGSTQDSAGEITIQNTAPVVSDVAIAPETGVFADSVLSCSSVNSDINEDALTLSYVWSNGGTELGTEETLTLDPSLASVGDSITCALSADDGEDSASGFVSVTVENTLPAVDSAAAITAAPNAITGGVLTCEASFIDLNDGALTPTYEWTDAAGTVLSSEATYTIDVAETNPEDVLTCTATATDVEGGSASSEATIAVVNSLPVINVSVDMETPTVTDSITCSVDNAVDIDENTVSYSYSWTIGDVVISETAATASMTDILTSGYAFEDEVICTVTPNDGYADGVPVSATATIANSLPAVSSVSFSPSTVTTIDLLTATVEGTDADEQDLSYNYDWHVVSVVDDEETDTSVQNGADNTLDGDTEFDLGDIVYVIVTPNDGIADGAPFESERITVVNAAPVVDSVSISPTSDVKTGTELTCTATITDAEDGTLTPTYAWFIGDTEIATGATYTVDAADSDVGDEIFCTASATDSNDSSVSGPTDPVTVSNTEPTVTNVGITSDDDAIYFDSTVTCAATITDPDETLTPTYTWTSLSVDATTPSELGTGETLDLTTVTIAPTDTLTCTVSVSDSEEAAADDFSDETVANHIPVVDSVSFTPTSDVKTGTTLTCTASISDTEDGTLTPTYAWFIGGTEIATGDVYVVDSTNTNVADSIFCRASATDTDGGEISGDTDAVEIANTEPTVTNVSITSDDDAIYFDSTVTCAATITDPDEDLTPTYTWTSGATELASGTDATFDLSTAAIVPDDVIRCTVSVTDTAGAPKQAFSEGTVVNRAPQAGTVLITWASSGDAPLDNEDLTCTASDFSDPDGTTLDITYTWSSDDGGSSTGATLDSGLTTAGETWTCTATAADGDLTAPDTTALSASGTDDALITASSIALTLNDADYTFTPENASDQAGLAIASAGDIDGNGADDILIAAPNYNVGAGRVYLFFGEGLDTTVNISLANADYIFDGENAGNNDNILAPVPGDYAGLSLAVADINGDDINEIIIGAPNHNSQTGKVYVVIEDNLPPSPATISLATADYHLLGESTGDQAGYSLAVADINGDNGDSQDDILVGAIGNEDGGADAGKVYVQLSTSLISAGTATVNLADADHHLLGEEAGDKAGYSISSAGDQDGDNKDDILIGAPYYDAQDVDAGKAYLVLSSTLSGQQFDLGGADYHFPGENAGDYAGFSVASVGDIDNDGLTDIAIGASGNDEQDTDAGKVYLILGDSLSSNPTLGSADYQILGAVNSANTGSAICSAGDLDGDGRDDILIGSPLANGSGQVSLFYGSQFNTTQSLLSSEAAVVINGINPLEITGSSVASGDFNGDGTGDLLIGTPDLLSFGSGKVTLFTPGF